MGPSRPPVTVPGALRGLGGVRPRRGAGSPVQVPPGGPGRVARRQDRPVRSDVRDAAEDGVRRVGPVLPMERSALAGLARRGRVAHRSHLHLRAAPGLVDAGPRRSVQAAELSRAGAAPRGPRQPARVHAHRAPPRDGAPLLRILGLPDHGILRAFQPVRDAAGLHVDGRPPAPGRHRRDPGLGPIALPSRRLRPGAVRRNASVRARRPAPGDPP